MEKNDLPFFLSSVILGTHVLHNLFFNPVSSEIIRCQYEPLNDKVYKNFERNH